MRGNIHFVIYIGAKYHAYIQYKRDKYETVCVA